MKLRNPRLIRLVATLVAVVVRVWFATLRVRMTSVDGQRHPVDPKSVRYIYAFWHETLLAALAGRGYKVQVLISQHADGELIAQACQMLGVGALRGSSTHGGGQALLEMIRGSDRQAHLVFMPDGPRGPRRQVKLGLVMVASQTGLPIMPVGVGFTSAWRVGSWDRFCIPRPFSTLVAVVGEPVFVPANLDRAAMQQYCLRVAERFEQVTDQAEAWAESLHRGDSDVSPPIAAAASWRKSA